MKNSFIDSINKCEIVLGDALERLGNEHVFAEEFQCTEENVELLHDEMIALYGGDYGIRDTGLFSSVCVAPYQSCFGQDLYPTVFDKAAKYLFDFANYQVFIDGNKRTGLALAYTYLNENSFDFQISSTDGYNLVLDVANGKYQDSSEIVEIIRENSVIKATPSFDYSKDAHEVDDIER